MSNINIGIDVKSATNNELISFWNILDHMSVDQGLATLGTRATTGTGQHNHRHT